MMKRNSAHVKEDSFEHVLMCLICRSLFDEQEHQPKFLPCHHTFCKDCLREYIRQWGDEIECPSCRKIATIPAAGVSALQTNFYVKYFQSLVRGGSSGSSPGAEVPRCSRHASLQQAVSQFCQTCRLSVCKMCIEKECAGHDRMPIAKATDECTQKLENGFEKCNSVIECKKTELEALMKALSMEKDEALKQIETAFEQHAHTLNRRATLLKNKVIDIYNDHARNLDCDMEEISTALTCIISLKEYHEELFSKGMFNAIEQGLSEIEEVYENISQQICPRETHIVFEEKHGMEKFKAVCKDLGRVTSNHPMAPRAEPIGGPNSDPENSPATQSALEESPYSDELGACGGAPLLLSSNDKCSPTRHLETRSCQLQNMDDLQLYAAPPQHREAPPQHREAPPQHREAPPQHREATSASIRGMGCGAGEDQPSTSGTDTGHPPAVRPKTLDPSNRKVKMHVPSSASSKSKSHHTIRGGANLHLPHTQSGSKRGLVASLNPKLHKHFNYRLPPMPDVESVRQTDKMYHHLVYTSYDEDELLRELRGAGKVVYTDPASLSNATHEADSWQTTSSGDELTTSLGEPQQTTL